MWSGCSVTLGAERGPKPGRIRPALAHRVVDLREPSADAQSPPDPAPDSLRPRAPDRRGARGAPVRGAAPVARRLLDPPSREAARLHAHAHGPARALPGG